MSQPLARGKSARPSVSLILPSEQLDFILPRVTYIWNGLFQATSAREKDLGTKIPRRMPGMASVSVPWSAVSTGPAGSLALNKLRAELRSPSNRCPFEQTSSSDAPVLISSPHLLHLESPHPEPVPAFRMSDPCLIAASIKYPLNSPTADQVVVAASQDDSEFAEGGIFDCLLYREVIRYRDARVATGQIRGNIPIFFRRIAAVVVEPSASLRRPEVLIFD